MGDLLRLRTARLELIAATAELARAELNDRAAFARLLDADVPTGWPPPLNDDDSIRWFAEYLAAHPNAVGWTCWYILLRDEHDRRTAIGGGGFKGEPDAAGCVEVGYSIMESHQRRGYAPEAVQALVAWAFSHAAVRRIVAQTFPVLRGSIRVLEKCGFTHVGAGFEDGTILYELLRPSSQDAPR